MDIGSGLASLMTVDPKNVSLSWSPTGDPLLLWDGPESAFVLQSGERAGWCSYLKGALRSSVFLSIVGMWLKCEWQLHILDPQLFNSLSVVWCRRGSMLTDLGAIALQNATLSRRGSHRRQHDVATWLSKLVLLQNHGSPPAAVINQWNLTAPPSSQLTGQKKLALMNLLQAPAGTTDLLLKHASEFCDKSAFSEECFANKQILLNYMPRHASKSWSKRLTVTAESFLLMMQFIDASHRRKLPETRAKLAKEAMAEASQLAALVTALEAELKSQGAKSNLSERLLGMG